MDSKDIKEIKAIIDLMKKHDLSVFEIEKEGFRLKLQRGASTSQPTTAAPAAAGGPAKGAVAGAEPPPVAKAIESVPMKEIVSPMVGTFYRAGSPDAPAFVEVGKPVTDDTAGFCFDFVHHFHCLDDTNHRVLTHVCAYVDKRRSVR